MEGWPYTTFPTGWFQVEWSKELVAGQVKTLHYFDQDIVLYRTESGRALAVEPYCPHLGAHLGYGGCVMGENLRCPWHGWQWDTGGHNAEIAFVDMTHPKARGCRAGSCARSTAWWSSGMTRWAARHNGSSPACPSTQTRPSMPRSRR